MSHMQATNIEQQNKLESEIEAKHGLQSEVSRSIICIPLLLLSLTYRACDWLIW